MKNVSLFVVFVLLISGCSRLTPKGSSVEVWPAMSDSETYKYKMVGTVQCRNNIYVAPKSVNYNICVDRLRNAASELEATVLVIDSKVELDTLLTTGYEMTAKVYKLNP